MKTENRPLEIVSRPGEFSVEVSCLLTGCYRLLSLSVASQDMFEGDFWWESVAEFSHSLGHERPLASKHGAAWQSIELAAGQHLARLLQRG